MSTPMNRRQFLKLGATGGLVGAMMPLFNIVPALAKPTIPARVQQTLAATAAALPSSLPLGAPLADISKGWDGTVWGIDTNGVPHQFDQLSQQWQVFGGGFDVITRADNSSYLLFRGTEVVRTGTTSPQPIASRWHNVPDSFALGIDGAANLGGVLYLFRNGRYLTIDPATQTASTPIELTSIAGWPTGANWAHGAIDAVGSNGTTINESRVLFWAKGEYIWVDMLAKKVLEGPHSLSYYVAGQMYAGMSQGFTTMLWDESNYEVQAFNGPIRWHSANRNGAAFANYINEFYPPWAPLLAHAPSGRSGALWAANNSVSLNDRSYPAHHDGQDWQFGTQIPSGNLLAVAAGSDDSIFGLTDSQLYRLDVTSGAWSPVAGAGAVQLAVGDASRVWVRDAQNRVYRLNGSSFGQVNLGHAAIDIAAGSDGTLWHAAGDTNVYRYIPEGSQPSNVLAGLTGAAVISKVAGTGFGEAYLLGGNAQLYQYDSPYVFKTAKPHFVFWEQWQQAPQLIAAAGHTVFLAAGKASQASANTVVALDAQTGVELWSREVPTNQSNSAQSTLLYDAMRQLLYVATALTIRALDPATGAVQWALDATSQLGSNFLVGLALSGNRLCASHQSGKLLLVDVDDALARGQQGHPALPLWITSGPSLTMAGIPAFDNDGTIYVAAYSVAHLKCNVLAVDPATGATRWQQTMAGSPTFIADIPLWDVVVGETYQHGTTTRTPALFVNGGDQIYALNPQNGGVISSFALPHGSQPNLTTSAMAYCNDRLYVGDRFGKLYVLNALTLTMIISTTDSDPNPPNEYGSWKGVLARPQLIAGKTASDGLIVAFTRGEEHVWFFDPDRGSIVSLSTDQTMACALDYDNAHGMLYSMGWAYAGNDSPSIGQVFALRPDSFIQDERSFIIESELLQDYANDAEAAGEGVSRYQTHVTIVDDSKAPRAGQSVKLWADEPNTPVSIDGSSYTIGPDTPALFTTDGGGSFTIVSDASDLAAVSLRIWSPFMDEHERLTITPDAAFHQRLAATTATGNGDPQQLDMVSATSYDNQPLFDNASQAQQAATAVTQLTSSVGMGGGARTLRHAGRLADADTSPYITYPDYAGTDYTPVNVGVNRDVSAQTALGMRLTSQGHATLTPAQAAALIDQMEGETPLLLGGSLSTLKNAWDEIKKTAAKVEQVVVSAAKDVYAGIVYVVNGITKVVKAIVQDIKDAAAAIGAFFVQLGKDILKVVQALSKFLRLDKVFTTARIISAELTASLQGLGPVLTQGKGILDGWLSNAEQEINDGFCQLYTLMGLPGCGASGGGPLNATQGMGATSSSVYNSASDGGQSQAVECGWSGHALRNNIDQATPVSTLATLAGDPLAGLDGLVNSFIDTLSSDPQLSASYASLRHSFSNTFKVTSPDEFFKRGLQDILEIFRAIAVTGVAIGKALIDTLLSDVNTLVQALLNLGAVKIPLLSTLWHKLTGKDLTFLDLISFVIAFPVTFIYRAVDGAYPSESAELQASGANTVTSKVMSLAGGVGQVIAGPMTALLDFRAVQTAGSYKPPRPLVVVGGLLMIVTVAQSIIKAAEASGEATMVAIATNSVLSLVLTISAPKIQLGALWGNFIINIFNIVFFRAKAVVHNDNGLTVGREVLGTIPTLTAPAKLDGPPVGYVVPALDLACRWAVAGIQLEQTISGWNKPGEEERFTLYLPMVGR